MNDRHRLPPSEPPPGDGLVERAVTRFREEHGEEPRWLVRAPGRVNLIGEHTDHQQGLVLPIAIDRSLILAAGPAPSSRAGRISATSERAGPGRPFEITDARTTGEWTDLLRGVLHSLPDSLREAVPGLRVDITGNLPPRSGLSSSAAVAVGFALVLSAATGIPLDRRRAAEAAVAAENDFLGVPCGIMDPMTVALADRSGALAIDCRNGTFTRCALPVPPPPFARVSTGIERELRSTPYATRVAECRETLRLLREESANVTSLRDVRVTDLDRAERLLPPPLFRRLRHVVTENARVTASIESIVAGEIDRLGQLLDASHQSLREDFEVSLPEIDRLVTRIRAAGARGVRLTGAGFGGDLLVLLPGGGASLDATKEAIGASPIERIRPADGARFLNPSER